MLEEQNKDKKKLKYQILANKDLISGKSEEIKEFSLKEEIQPREISFEETQKASEIEKPVEERIRSQIEEIVTSLIAQKASEIEKPVEKKVEQPLVEIRKEITKPYIEENEKIVEESEEIEEEGLRQYLQPRYIFLVIVPLVLIVAIVYFKPYNLVVNFFRKEKALRPSPFLVQQSPSQETSFSYETAKPTLVFSPLISPELSPREITPIGEPVSKLPPFLSNLKEIDLQLSKLDNDEFFSVIKNFMLRQEEVGTKFILNFVLGNKKLEQSFIFNYFIRPQHPNISVDELNQFKTSLTPNYWFVIYYGPTRKYSLIIFEIRNKDKVLEFNEKWESLTMDRDLKTLFFENGFELTGGSFEKRKIFNYDYKFLKLGENYVILWSIVDNYLIYSNTEVGYREIVKQLVLK